MDFFQGSSEVINNINDVTKGEISRKPISKSLKKKPLKSYECSECDYQTDNSSNLTKHSRTHTGEKPFECDLCQKKFSLQGVLKRHIMTHGDRKRHECDICVNVAF